MGLSETASVVLVNFGRIGKRRGQESGTGNGEVNYPGKELLA